MVRYAFLLLAIVSLQVSAQAIYRTTDADGNVVFTDAPPAGVEASERIENPQVNSMPPPALMPAPERDSADEPTEPQGYEVSIVSPPNETTIPNGPGNFSVSADVAPGLAPGDNLQLYMDGVPWGEPQGSGIWQLTNVFRGEHSLNVGVIDASGDTVTMSSPVTVFVFRPGL